MATLGKPQRQHRIPRLLEEQPISSQAQLVELLAADGVVATQATVSRDLEELGAVKVRIPGGAMAYAIPEHAKERITRRRRPSPPADGRVRGRGRAQREPRRAADATRERARRRLGARPGRVGRRARHRGRRRHDHAGVRRAVTGGDDCRAGSPSSPACSIRTLVDDEGDDSDGQASGAGVLRRSRHVGRGAVDRGRSGASRSSRARSTSASSPTATGTTIRERALAAGAVEVEVDRRARRVRRRLPRPRAPRPTRCTRASTRSCPRCRAR